MGGGLIQIVSYGLHDVFLIGDPQITFFKMVYRKHTNFAMEYLEEQMYGTQNFGNTLHCTLSKTGDLIHKLYIKIAIPQIALDRIRYSDVSSLTDNYPSSTIIYNKIQNFLNFVVIKIINPLYKMLTVNNLTFEELNSAYSMLYKNTNYAGELLNIKGQMISFNDTFRVLLLKDIFDNESNIISINKKVDISTYIDFNNYYIQYISTIPNNSKNNTAYVIDRFSFLLNNYVLQLQMIKSKIFNNLSFMKNISNKINRENINFAWVDFLGHQIINQISIYIGGKRIDFTNGLFMNIRYHLMNKFMHDHTLDVTLGNVPELTTFNSDTKPPYIMCIPIDFWFTKYSGLSLPLIHLRYHDVKIEVILNDLTKCCYFEKLKSDVVIEDLIKLDSVSLVANYIYLDNDERVKFAQMNQEYLIDQMQHYSIDGINNNKSDIEINFFNPVKQLFWFIRDVDNINRLKYFDYSSSVYIDIYSFDNTLNEQFNNTIKIRTVDTNIKNFIKVNDTINILNSLYYNGSYKVVKVEQEFIYIIFNTYIVEDYKYNYDVEINNKITIYTKKDTYIANSQAFIYKDNKSNPIISSTLYLNNTERFTDIDEIYSNFVQPYECNTKAPLYGINCFSFALKPEEYQPSGSCNFSRLDKKILSFLLNKSYVNESTNKNLQITVFAHSYNILQLAYGKASIMLNI